jgi:hypothetical protein
MRKAVRDLIPTSDPMLKISGTLMPMELWPQEGQRASHHIISSHSIVQKRFRSYIRPLPTQMEMGVLPHSAFHSLSSPFRLRLAVTDV